MLRRSLKTRVTLFTLAIFVISIWSLAFYASQSLREDMKRLLSDQQFSTASIVATEINEEMRDRMIALETMAKNVTPALLGQPVALQALLEQRSLLQVLFNGGAFVTRLDGMAVASVPLSAGRAGINFMDRDYVVGAIKEGKGTIGKPLMGLFIKSPLFAMAVPIRDVEGKVIGALMGVVDLGHPNFLDRIVDKSYGKSGGYLIVAPQHRLIVTATDRRRIMAPTAASSADSLVARFNSGYEGSGILVNPLGEEMLSSAKAIPVAGWYLVTNLPVEEAFAPIRDLQQRVLLAAILLTMLAGGLTWWMLRFQLAPMLAAANMLARISDANQYPRALPVTRQDEIGELVGGFNRLIEMLRERESRFQDIAKASADWIWEINTEGRYTYVSDSVEGLLGYNATEIIGKTPFDLMPPGEAERVLAIFNTIVAQRRPFRDLDNINRHNDGSLRHVQTNGVPIFDNDGEFVGYRGLDRDITERKHAEAAHEQLASQLRESQKMEAIGTLAGGIAHDFNNALATILGNVELARQDVSTNSLALESLEEIRKAGSRTRDLVQQILSFSRKQPIERKQTELVPLIEESARLLRATLPARLTLEVQCDADVPAVFVDASQIQQVLINLATNAMQAAHGSTGQIDIRVDTVMLDGVLAETHPAIAAMYAKHPGRAVRIAVSDDGAGMDDATRARVFDPFFTTKPVGEGTGLGLSVVHGIVHGHEGAITVDSVLGKGTTFALYLPAADPKVSPSAQELDESAGITAPTLSLDGGKHILYIDDDESMLFLVQRLLERRGFRVSGYADQFSALNALRADPVGFDLVVTDYNMPGMSGLDVAREVRAIRADLPVAIASGFIDEALRAQAAGAGVRELIFKAAAAEDVCEAFARLALTTAVKLKSS